MWQVTRVLIVCSVSTILNWENEFKIWLPDMAPLMRSTYPGYQRIKKKRKKVKKAQGNQVATAVWENALVLLFSISKQSNTLV
jgi:SNF2 family DNA or RNA helicase